MARRTSQAWLRLASLASIVLLTGVTVEMSLLHPQFHRTSRAPGALNTQSAPRAAQSPASTHLLAAPTPSPTLPCPICWFLRASWGVSVAAPGWVCVPAAAELDVTSPSIFIPSPRRLVPLGQRAPPIFLS